MQEEKEQEDASRDVEGEVQTDEDAELPPSPPAEEEPGGPSPTQQLLDEQRKGGVPDAAGHEEVLALRIVVDAKPAAQGPEQGDAVSRLETALGNGQSKGARYPIQIGLDWIAPSDIPSSEGLLSRYDSIDGPTREVRLTGALSLTGPTE